MKLISLSNRPLTPTDFAAIERFRLKAGNLPFLCMTDQVMLLLTPGQTEEALLQEAQALMAANLAARPAMFVHRFPDTRCMVRTVRDLCVMEAQPGASYAALLRKGLRACRRGSRLALVLPEEATAPSTASQDVPEMKKPPLAAPRSIRRRVMGKRGFPRYMPDTSDCRSVLP